MLRRAQGTAFVCLRCRSRLLRQYSASVRHLTTPYPPHALVHPNITEEQRNFIKARTIEKLPPEFRKKRTRYDGKEVHILGRIRRKGGQEVEQSSATLSIDRLGAPADVIILRDVDSKLSEDTTSTRVASKPFGTGEVSEEQILSTLEDEKQAPNKNEIIQQIDKIRLSLNIRDHVDGIVVTSPKDYTKTYHTLLQQYTASQLNGYLKQKSTLATQTADIVHRDRAEKKTQLQVAQWRPSLDPSKEPIPLTDWRPWANIKARKSRLAVRIMRDNWQLMKPDEIEGSGLLEVQKLTDVQFDLLTGGASPRLQQISALRTVGFEISRPQRSLRITGSRVNVVHALQDIRMLLGYVYRGSLALQPFEEHRRKALPGLPPITLEEDELRAIEGLTRTAVDPVSKKRKVHFNAGSQDDLDDAIRATMSVLHQKMDRSRYQALARSKDYNLSELPVSYQPLPVAEELPFALRSQPIMRLTGITSRNSSGQHNSAEALITGKLQVSVERQNPDVSKSHSIDDTRLEALRRSLLENTLDESRNPLKSMSISKLNNAGVTARCEQSITFGNLLTTPFNQKPPKLPNDILGQPAKTFVAVVPGLAHVVTGFQGFSERPQKDTLLFHLVPQPTTAVSAGFPALEIEFYVNSFDDSTPTAVLSRVRWQISHTTADVELPSTPVDLRISRDFYIEIRPEAIECNKDYEDLQSWIKEAQKSIIEPGPIRPPSKLTTSFPQTELMTKWGQTSTKTKKGTKRPKVEAKENPSEELPSTIEYIFLRVEHREANITTFEDLQLSHIGRDGGTLGGKSSYLTLQVPTTPNIGETTRQSKHGAKKSQPPARRLVEGAIKLLQVIQRKSRQDWDHGLQVQHSKEKRSDKTSSTQEGVSSQGTVATDVRTISGQSQVDSSISNVKAAVSTETPSTEEEAELPRIALAA